MHPEKALSLCLLIIEEANAGSTQEKAIALLDVKKSLRKAVNLYRLNSELLPKEEG